MLDAFAAIGREIFLNLGLVVCGFVDGYADLAIGAGHGARFEAGELAFDVEVAHLAEIEEPLIEIGPLVHVAPKYVVGDMVDPRETRAAMPKAMRGIGGDEIHIVDGVFAIAVD